MDKILSFYKDAKILEKGDLVVPRMVSVWPSNSCNLHCDYCGYSSVRDGTLMDEDKFKRLINELSDLGAESLEFTGGGEPTFHPGLFDFAYYAVKQHLRIGMFTNGFRFDWDKVKYFDYIRIGLDAIDQDSYYKIKGIDVFDKVINHIKTLVETNMIYGNPIIGIKFVIDENNYNELIRFISFVANLGVNYVNFRRIFKVDKTIEYHEANKNFDRAKKLYPYFIYGDFDFPDLKHQCFMAPIHAVIMADGSLLNCCYFNDKDHIIGNVFEKGFKDVWFSKRHIEILNSIPPSECNKWSCRWRSYNNQMRDVLAGKGFISFI